MTAALRAHLLSLRTLPSSLIVVLSAVVLVAVLAAVDLGELIQVASVTSTELRGALLSIVGSVCATILLLFAAVKTSGEYRHGTMGIRLLAEPRRLRLLTVTVTGSVIVALLTVAVAVLAALAVAVALLAGTDLALGFTAPMLLAAVLGVTLFSVLGATTGIICRSQAGALSTLIGWFAAEKVLGGFLGGAGEYLPFALLNPLLGAPGAAVPIATAAATLTAITGAVALTAAILFRRRDVS